MAVGINTTGAGVGSRDRTAKLRAMAKDKERVGPSRHVDGGTFPHFGRTTGLCMCLLSCCFGANGCKCRPCPCDHEGHKSYGLHSGKLQRPGEFSSGPNEARPEQQVHVHRQ